MSRSRGDVFVFYSVTEPGLHLVKRVIGIPGDRIQLVDDVVYRNGQRLDEPYVQHVGQRDPYGSEFPALSPNESLYPLAPEWRLTLASHIENGDDRRSSRILLRHGRQSRRQL